jgi:hypothetical protein
MTSQDRNALLDSLRSTDAGRQSRVLAGLAAADSDLDAELVDAVLPMLGVVDKQLSRRAAAVLSRAVCEHVEHARSQLLAALDSESALLRWGAAFALAEAGVFDAAVGEAALDALRLDDGDIRWAAAAIVRAVAEREPAFLLRLEEVAAGSSGEQRKMSIYCLRDLGRCDPALYVGALGAADVGTRHAALSALQACGEAGADTVDAVVARLAVETDIGVRRSLAIVLGRIMGPHAGAVKALRRAAASSEDADFRRAVESVLRDR